MFSGANSFVFSGKYRNVASFQYRSEDKTPNGLRERSDWKWELRFSSHRTPKSTMWEGNKCRPLGMQHLGNIPTGNTHRNFQSDRSRSLLGVWSSDWYWNEATFLYFPLKTKLFAPENIVCSKNWKNSRTWSPELNLNRYQHWRKILENQENNENYWK